jgi:histidinol-phosphate aminotransferase
MDYASQTAGIAILENIQKFSSNISNILQQRIRLSQALESMNFQLTPSCANFVFALPPTGIDTDYLFEELKKRKIIVEPIKDTDLAPESRSIS